MNGHHAFDTDIAELQQETEQLLASIRGGPAGRSRQNRSNEKGGKGSGGDKAKKKGGKKSKRRKEGHREAGRPSHKQARETVEILDTGDARSPNPKKSKRSAKKLDPAKENMDEDLARNLPFDEENRRVQEARDTFIPKKGMTLEDLHAERDRVDQIAMDKADEKLREKEMQAIVQDREEWLGEDTAALDIQRAFRGHVDRQRVSQSLSDQAVVDQAREEWVEVRDEETGDVWYLNQITGESQWEMPAVLMPKILPQDRVKRLPSLGSDTPSSDQEEVPKENLLGGDGNDELDLGRLSLLEIA